MVWSIKHLSMKYRVKQVYCIFNMLGIKIHTEAGKANPPCREYYCFRAKTIKRQGVRIASTGAEVVYERG